MLLKQSCFSHIYLYVIFLYRTFNLIKQDCPAHIYMKINPAGSALQVRSINTEHNHVTSQVLQHEKYVYTMLMCEVFTLCVFHMLNWMYTVYWQVHYCYLLHTHNYRSYSSTCPSVSVNYQVMFEPKPVTYLNANKKMVQMQLTKRDR